MDEALKDCPKLPWMVDFHSTDNGLIPNTQMKAAFANTTMEYLSCLNVKSKASNFRSTQLICTIPLQATCNTLEELMSNGMSVARIKLPIHNNFKAAELISKIRAVTESYSRKIGKIYPLAIGIEIRGPEIRIGQLRDSTKKEIPLEKGKITSITNDPSYEEYVNEDMIYVDYQKLHEVVQPGDKVLLVNGSVTLSAIEVAESVVRCLVEKAGNLISNDSVTILNVPIDLPLVSSKDKEIIKFGIEQNVDIIFISAVVNRESVWQVKQELGIEGEHILMVCKIENSQAIDNFEEILKVSDGICLDFDKLMLELPKEKVFLAQKSLLAKCNLAGKPVVCTVHIADINTVSKSECSDIANVIIDGADALLIPQEACVKEVVKSISIICKEAEPAVPQKVIFNELTSNISIPMEAVYSLAISVVEASVRSNAAAIICLTCSGRTAKILTRFRPRCPIIAITRYPRVARQLRLFRGVDSIIYLRKMEKPFAVDVNERLQLGVTYGKYMKLIRMGDAVVTVAASRPDSGLNNSMRIIYASDFDTLDTTK